MAHTGTNRAFVFVKCLEGVQLSPCKMVIPTFRFHPFFF
jgi:hypothetical protein